MKNLLHKDLPWENYVKVEQSSKMNYSHSVNAKKQKTHTQNNLNNLNKKYMHLSAQKEFQLPLSYLPWIKCIKYTMKSQGVNFQDSAQKLMLIP